MGANHYSDFQFTKHSRISVYKTDSIYKRNPSTRSLDKGWQSYEKSYSGDDETIRKALTSVLGIATNDTSKVELKIKTDAAGNLITNVEITVVDEGEQTRKEYTIAYLQFNEQQKKALPQ